ncbi:MAG: hypothetical protein KGM43_07435 [Planctomycetota bacterium]|nr:hypothetical protein [Planctomycetota bacterium]
MSKVTRPAATLRALEGSWGRLGKWRRRLVFGVLGIAAIAASVLIYVKLTAWPPRLVLSVGEPIATRPVELKRGSFWVFLRDLSGER